MANIRFRAANIINEVTEGRSLSDLLDFHLPKIADGRDRAFVQAVCYGVCRYYTQLDVILSELLQSPMEEKDTDVHALVLVGLFQLKFMRLPHYAAVTETVNATERFQKRWSRGFVNAILRSYLRESDRIERVLENDEEGYFAHPEWWIRSIKRAWPQQWQDILEANNEHPPFSLRVNLKHISREAYLEKLVAAEIDAAPIEETSAGIILSSPMNVDDLPGFADGDVFVQDGAAQLCADIMQLEDGMHVLDACAAPGGKLTHILATANVTAVAVERDKHRTTAIKNNLARMKVEAECVCADAADTKSWWDEKLFDRILLDAPCTASGIIRRHPDIKLLRQESDVKPMTQEQDHLLNKLWPLLKKDGLFLYATCSVFPQENAILVARFLKEHADAKEEKLDVSWGLEADVGRQILPGMHKMDGFYYALLRKV